MTNEIDISKVLIEGDTATIMGEKYKRVEEPKSPAEKAYYAVYGWYPPTTSSVSNYEDNRWRDFQNGYDAAYEEKVVEEETEREMIKRNLKTSLQELVNGDVRPIDDVVRETKNQQIKELVRESVKWCEEHREESVEDYLRPKTPEQTEKSLKEAFVKVQQTEQWKETQRKIDAPKESWMNKSNEELVAILKKNPPDCLKFVMGKTLEQIITRWWCDTFTGPHEKWSMEECIDDLIDQIELFLPRSQSAEGTQSVYTEVAVESHNELLQKIKSKLRNKK
jgi:uncharacterized membrane protein YheB (UPF0754 family)